MPEEAYVWVWLPLHHDPVVCGVVRPRGAGPEHDFTYGRSYLERPGALPLAPELPLVSGRQRPNVGLDVAGVLLDGTPDSWGRRVVNERVLGRRDRDSEPSDLSLLTYMLESGSDRIGALDFQASPSTYLPRTVDSEATLEQLLHAAEMLEEGEEMPTSLSDALLLGSTVGGARPKALIRDGDRRFIAKFPSTTDQLPYVRYEAVAMELSRRAGIETARTDIVRTAGRDVLLVERFDRRADGGRRMQLSAATILGLNPERAVGAMSYVDLAERIRADFDDPSETLVELFRRIVLNVLVRNTDDHARNHAAFWDGRGLNLTPAYDVTSSHGRIDSVASHPMSIAPGDNRSLLAVCVRAAPVFHLTSTRAHELIDELVGVVQDHWSDAADAAHLTQGQRQALWQTSILNPAIWWEA